MTKPELDLVAVAYQAPVETARFLDSLGLVDVPFTLTIIDNNSPNQTVREAINLYRHKVEFNHYCVGFLPIYNAENVGYAKAINHGVALGTAPIVAALNCDTQFLRKSASEIVSFFNEPANERVGIIGPRTVSSENRLTHAGIVRNEALKQDLHRGWLHPSDGNNFRDTIEVPTVSGATYFARRTMWNELTNCPIYQEIAPSAKGAFLPTQHFYEETWCSYHARAHDWSIKYCGRIDMIHEWHKSSVIGSQDMEEPRKYFEEACKAHGINEESAA